MICFGEPFSSMIASYSVITGSLKEVNERVIQSWNDFLLNSSSEDFVDRLYCNQIFRSNNISLLSRSGFVTHIRPLLIDMASQDGERASLIELIYLLKEYNFYLTINPIFADPNKSLSEAGFGFKGELLQEEIVEDKGLVLSRVPDSCTIILQVNCNRLHLLVHKNGKYYLGMPSLRSCLVHESDHLVSALKYRYLTMSYSQISYQFSNFCWRWKSPDEEATIRVENSCLFARDEMTRLTYVTICSVERFVENTLLYQMTLAIRIGADGTMENICQRYITASSDSEERQSIETNLHKIANAYIKPFPSNKTLEKFKNHEKDRELQKLITEHKNIALSHLLDAFRAIKRNELVITLCRKIQFCIAQRAHDPI